MKIRNKKTGEIADLEYGGLLKSDNNNHIIVYPEGTLKYYAYNSLAELNAEWEDYEEPKEYWYMDYGGRIKAINDANDEEDVARKEIGNYFETEEEAKKAVEKLKAWKRLRDKGSKIIDYEYYGGTNTKGEFSGEVKVTIGVSEVDKYLFNLLFGGEE